jgi:DNA polymerase-3 subunit beta
MGLKPGTKTMNLKCGRYEANINGIDADDFPAIPSAADGASWRVSARVLRLGIAQAAFAAATDETRPVLSGVLLTLEGDQLTLAAADGFRLAVRGVPLMDPVTEKLSLLVPARTLIELARVLDDTDDAVEIAATPNQNQILFRTPAGLGQTPNLLVVSRLIEGQFPDYQRIIPQGFQTRVVLSLGEFLQATKTAAVFSRDNSNIVRVSVTPSGSELTPGVVEVTATSAEMGDDVGQLDGSVEGEQIEIAFNVRYLRDALEAVGGGEVALEMTGPTSPGLIKPVADGNHLHVIMPMHVAR